MRLNVLRCICVFWVFNCSGKDVDRVVGKYGVFDGGVVEIARKGKVVKVSG